MIGLNLWVFVGDWVGVMGGLWLLVGVGLFFFGWVVNDEMGMGRGKVVM